MLWRRQSRKIRKALAREPERRELVVDLARALRDEGRAAEALAELHALIEDDLQEADRPPEWLAPARSLAARCAWEVGERDLALRLAGAVLSEPEAPARVGLDAALVVAFEGAPSGDGAETLRALFRKAAEELDEPGRSEALLGLARVELAQGEAEAARQALEAIAARDDASPLLSWARPLVAGEALLAAGGDSRAVADAFTLALRRARTEVESVRLNQRIGHIYLRRGRPAEAIQRFEGALRYLGTGAADVAAGLHLDLARCYRATGQPEQALGEADRGLTLLAGADRADLAWELTRLQIDILRRQEKFAAAQARLEAFLERAGLPDALRAAARLLRARLLRHQLLRDEARVEVENLLAEPADLDPALVAEARRFLAELLLIDQRPAEALALLDQIETPAAGEERDELLLLRGTALLRERQIVEAVAILSELYRTSAVSHVREEAEAELRTVQQLLEDARGLVVSEREKAELVRHLGEFMPVSALDRLRRVLRKTRQSLIHQLDAVLRGAETLDDDLLDEVEEVLILADIGVEATMKIMDGVRDKVLRRQLRTPAELREHLKSEIHALLGRFSGRIEVGEQRPYVIMVVGVNGVGKTTTIAKLAHRFREEGHRVLLAAADTFRAGAIEQLAIWADRVGADLVRHKAGSDPAAVAFDAIKAAKARGVDVVIVDTAGRLHTKVNLMEELKKIRRVIGRELPGAPHETLLVLDATTGQNALNQARTFHEATDITGVALTKLDGTAKGGIVVSIVNLLNLPIKLIGVGEGVGDIRDFHAQVFAEALLGEEDDSAVAA